MRAALAEAGRAMRHSPPNPAVGCMVVTTRGESFGGHTQPPGQGHAEVQALAALRAHGASTAGATVYVTLEPCAHFGRTPPCADALVAAGVGRVVVAVVDPNPLVAGKGIERLRAAGIRVDVGLLADEAREVNLGFFSRMVRGVPWVRMKIAASLDGQTALENGRSQWITGPSARADGHAWRARAGAVLTGIGTVLEDDPRLDVREVPTARQPLRVVLDSGLQMPGDARILQPPGTVLVYAAREEARRRAVLEAAGAELALLPGPGGKVDLHAVLKDLARRGVNELHVEAGHKLNGSLLQAGLVDEFLVYLAPKLVGQGRGMLRAGPLESLDQAVGLRYTEVSMCGDDLRIIARPPGRERF
nr:bifunctional diaminohydroxyphosphoribosylaminopyrimidine deaminase/5-amino-6-(5-phosphoribosylamino)uracil reductase RibD [Methylibium rhizosphaerae]